MAEQKLYVISQHQLQELEPAFKHFEKATGVRIDLYGDTKFSSGNAVLIKSLEGCMDSDSRTKVDIIETLTTNDKIVFVGD